MKHFLFLLFFTYTTISFSQVESNSFNDKYGEFDYYAKPDKTNKLSIYLKNHIDSKLLDAYKISDTAESKKHIYLSFSIFNQNNINDIKINTPYFELNKSIKQAFKNYNIKDLNIAEKSPLNIYQLQILSVEGDKMVVNCSTNIICDRFPVYEGCGSATSYSNMRSCLTKQLEAHIAKYISPIEIKKAKMLGTVHLEVQFLINKEGAIEKVNCKASTNSLTEELNRVVLLFPKAKIPPTRNGKPSTIIYKGVVSLEIESDNEKYVEEILKSNDSTLNPNNELALHFKNYMSEQELNEINFPMLQKNISVIFGISENGQYINVKTNCKNPTLESRLVDIFKKFPLEKLNIKFNNVLESYQYTIITHAYNKKGVITCSDKPIILIPPLFDENCQKSSSSDELMNCFWQNIHNTIRRNFDTTLLSKTKLSGKFKINCFFEIDTDAKIKNVKVQAPDQAIAIETERIIKKISNVYKPAYSNGIAIKKYFKFTIPIVLEKENNDPFKTGLENF